MARRAVPWRTWNRLARPGDTYRLVPEPGDCVKACFWIDGAVPNATKLKFSHADLNIDVSSAWETRRYLSLVMYLYISVVSPERRY